jgi:hypothetical protein
MTSRRKYGEALRKINIHVPGGVSSLPLAYPLHERHDVAVALRVGRMRVRSWFSLRNRLDDLDEEVRKCGSRLLDADWHEAEEAIRLSLKNAAESFNWLDDARQDLGRDQLINVQSFTGRSCPPISMGDLVDDAHAAVHTTGEIVGGLFGCRITYKDGRWYDECIVSLLHLRFGNSVGMRVRYECTICRQDPSDCEHEPGLLYSVNAARTDNGECMICWEAGCSTHRPGDDYQVIARARMTDPVLREVSLTGRPRDPLARIAARSVDDEDLHSHLGRLPQPGDMVLDHACMYPCRGFTESSELED